ncbi:FRG domain-containing protein, partial [Staphylococcus pseudintermedius]|nr:FRG domain-containing protein [Staphylococcus pseudintermedius]
MAADERFSYKNIKTKYVESDYFDTVEIKIPLTVINPDKSPSDSYKIEGLSVAFENYSEHVMEKKDIQSKIKDINEKIENYRLKNNKEWNIFYLFKELIQKFHKEENYYRGQVHNWDMLPGILRAHTNSELQNRFESLYQDIMYRYPNEIDYFEPRASYDVIKERELNLAYLQHYGMNTSLLDITENPYIALLFMITDNSDSFNKATFEIYKINKEKHSKNNIYSRVKMLNSNQRIIAQKGAFLNFDKVSLFTFNSDIKRILMIRISLEHNFEDLEDLMAKRKELDKDKNEGGLFNNNNIEIYREWWEINLEIDKKKRYFNDSYLDSI